MKEKMKRVKVEGMRFINEDGNQVIFNGINLVCKEKEKGYLEFNIEQLLEVYSKKGFNLVRLGVFWDGVEPKPGVYDDAYLDKVAKVVEKAEQCGIYIMLDMHQDLYSVKYGDGAPEWATLDEGLNHPENLTMWYEAYLSSQAIMKATDNFWANKEASDGVGLIDHYAAMWEYIAKKFKGYSNIIGIEPMNEPYMGSIAAKAFNTAIGKIKENNPDFDMTNLYAVTSKEQEIIQKTLTDHFIKFDKEILMPFYNRILQAVRRVSDLPIITGGNIYSSSFVKTGIEKIRDENGNIDTQQIYGPHGYDSVTDSTNYEAYNKENISFIFAQKRLSQEELQLPVIVGEWGAFPSKDFTNEYIEHMAVILEQYLWSSTYWVHYSGIETDPNYSSLERGYPPSVSGTLLSYHYDYEKKSLSAKWKAKRDGTTILYVPDLSAVNPQMIYSSTEVKINIRKFKDAPGGFVSIYHSEEGMIEVKIPSLPNL